ncbi:Uncharacterized conserved protein YbjT, contains NAD(P)-binding and DUF2867 domains [Streptomyces zhaozhouensis]|uniref:Uncharacterized conserved protein YbjT, contains NAD(P)-binding and DUF2867 domains n=1 Tax=Streptomyces zhaozhouensis TaxID=1300267 RepID=A0A286DWM3_9ACTN|nr:Uncharacterized conserved protein YbjT, contains NAD(P)-binding and DUF2867 domains [Streptomyces zhaozhouensis]
MLGATGQQGGAVAAALRAGGWAVRAVVRDPAGARARALSAAGVEVVRGDLGDAGSLRAAFSGAYGVFSVQPSAGQPGSGVSVEEEFRFGTRVVEIAERSGVAHLVYSSTVAAGPTETGVAHLDVKSRVEERVRASDVAATIVRPATFMEILTLPGAGPGRELSFLMRPDQAMQFIAVRDIGRVVAGVLAAPDRYAGRTREIAGDALTGRALAEALTRAAGRPIGYGRLPDAVLEGDEVLGRTAALVDSGRLVGHADLDALRAEFPFLLRFDQWLAGPGAGLVREASR